MYVNMQTKEPQKKADERRAWILYRLKLAGYNFASLAREYGLSRTCVMSALYKRYPKMERLIAEKLGTTPEALWPERYSPCLHGSPRRRNRQ